MQPVLNPSDDICNFDNIVSLFANSKSITVRSSNITFRLPGDYPLINLSGIKFYTNGELFGDDIYICIALIDLIIYLAPYGTSVQKASRKRRS